MHTVHYQIREVHAQRTPTWHPHRYTSPEVACEVAQQVAHDSARLETDTTAVTVVRIWTGGTPRLVATYTVPAPQHRTVGLVTL